jgi:hypothetical protein
VGAAAGFRPPRRSPVRLHARAPAKERHSCAR